MDSQGSGAVKPNKSRSTSILLRDKSATKLVWLQKQIRQCRLLLKKTLLLS